MWCSGGITEANVLSPQFLQSIGFWRGWVQSRTLALISNWNSEIADEWDRAYRCPTSEHKAHLTSTRSVTSGASSGQFFKEWPSSLQRLHLITIRSIGRPADLRRSRFSSGDVGQPSAWFFRRGWGDKKYPTLNFCSRAPCKFMSVQVLASSIS